jgi:hypothetical protein
MQFVDSFYLPLFYSLALLAITLLALHMTGLLESGQWIESSLCESWPGIFQMLMCVNFGSKNFISLLDIGIILFFPIHLFFHCPILMPSCFG